MSDDKDDLHRQHPGEYVRISDQGSTERTSRGVEVVFDMVEDETPLPFNIRAPHLSDEEQIAQSPGGNVICLCFEVELVCKFCGR